MWGPAQELRGGESIERMAYPWHIRYLVSGVSHSLRYHHVRHILKLFLIPEGPRTVSYKWSLVIVVYKISGGGEVFGLQDRPWFALRNCPPSLQS